MTYNVEKAVRPESSIHQVCSGISKTEDIINNNGRFVDTNYLKNKFNTKINELEYNHLKAKIPKEWIYTINGSSKLNHENINKNNFFQKNK